MNAAKSMIVIKKSPVIYTPNTEITVVVPESIPAVLLIFILLLNMLASKENVINQVVMF